MAYKMHWYIRHTSISPGQIKKKQSTNIKLDEINRINVINDNSFIGILNNDNKYMKVTLKSQLTRVASLLTSGDYCEF